MSGFAQGIETIRARLKSMTRGTASAISTAASAGAALFSSDVAPPTLSVAATAAKLDAGAEFLLDSTVLVRDQRPTAETCCAMAVSAAMETWCVVRGADAIITSIDPANIWEKSKHKRSLHAACGAASEGVPDQAGATTKAATEYLGACSIEHMIVELRAQTPLMVDIHVRTDFADPGGPFIYRPNAADAGSHAMCIVGYGTDAVTGESYWIAKNSYGNQWRRGGFVGLLWNDGTVKPERTVHAMRGVAP